MTASALRFRADALRAHARVARLRASTARGRQAKGLALRALASYARAGSWWAASGRARLLGERGVAASLARVAAADARSGNRLFVAAGKLLR
jgi:hypothetical protein